MVMWRGEQEALFIAGGKREGNPCRALGTQDESEPAARLDGPEGWLAAELAGH